MRRERTPSRMRSLLWFLLGGLVGANAMYFVMSRDPARATSPDAAPAGERVEMPLPIGGTEPIQPVLPPPVVQISGAPITLATATLAPAASLLVPVQGIPAAQLLDTFTDSRSEGRSHDAIDIMAAAGTPVLAVADGRIEKLFTSKQGGLTVYQFNRDRTVAYYYAHLQRYADGIAEQREIRRGELVGYVGVTGNSDPNGPHLHFAIFELGPEKQWWKGVAINPYAPLGGTTTTR